MKLKPSRLAVSGFMCFHDTSVELPQRGVVLVQGERSGAPTASNGTGKSAFIDALSWALYGKTLRGAVGDDVMRPPMIAARTHLMHTNGFAIERARERSKTSLVFDGSKSYYSATEKQEALQRRLPSWIEYVYSTVFSGTAQASFTSASESDCRALFDELLSMDALAEYKRKADDDVRATSDALTELDREQAALEAVLSEWCAIQDNAEPAVVSKPPRKPREAPEAIQQRLSAAMLANAKHLAEREQTQEQLVALKQSKCPTCKRTFLDAGEREKQARQLEWKRDDLDKLLASSEVHMDNLTSLLEDRRKEWREYNDALVQHSAAAAAAYAAKQAARKIASTKRALAAAMRKHAKLTKHLEHAAFWSRGFGSTGVRSYVIEAVLPYLNTRLQANMTALFTSGSIDARFATSMELKGGSARDKIGVNVLTNGRTASVRSLSSGERRRVDVAVMLAIADYASSASRMDGYDWIAFDEVFENLDTEGVEAVASLLSQIKRRRSLVFITTHDPRLSEAIEATHVLTASAANGNHTLSICRR